MHLTPKDLRDLETVFGPEGARIVRDPGLALRSSIEHLETFSDARLLNQLRCGAVGLAHALADVQALSGRMAEVGAVLVHRQQQRAQQLTERKRESSAERARVRRPMGGAEQARPRHAAEGGPGTPTREQIDAAIRELKRPGVGGSVIAGELNRRGMTTRRGLHWTEQRVTAWLQ